MAYEQKEGDIAIFKVKKKTSEKVPDWTGKCLINGVEKQVSFWEKSDTMLTGQIKEKFTSSSQTTKKPTAPRADEFEDEIPF